MEWAKKWGVFVVMGVVGAGLLGYGLWEKIAPGEVKVEVISGESANLPAGKAGQQIGESTRHVVVDVAGAVMKSGVYKLQSGSRIGDALVAAGGLSATADRAWVAKNLNLAKELKDQEKVYIPELDADKNPKSQSLNSKQIQNSNVININTASAGELDKLAGIGEVRARTIIENRPYSSTEELVSKAKIPQSVYEKIKTSISAY